MKKSKKILDVFKQIAFFLICMSPLFYHQYIKNKRNNAKLNECCYYTIINPIRMPDTHKMYYWYCFNRIKKYNSCSVGAQDLGPFYTKKSALSRRYIVKFYCDDSNINSVQWDILVPDTLRYVPENGWKEIPYGLDKVKE